MSSAADAIHDMPSELARLAASESAKYGFTLEQIREPSRKAARVWVRKNIARIAVRRGATHGQISTAIGRERSTVSSMLKSKGRGV
jgi:hypothetical protein